MHSSVLTFITLLITSSVSASSIPGFSNVERRHEAQSAVPFAIYIQQKYSVPEVPITSQRYRFQCDKKSYSGVKVQDALDRGCRVFKENKQRRRFPQSFTAFKYQDMTSLNEWPLQWTHSYQILFPGNKRVIFDNECKLAGLVVREKDRTYTSCTPMAA
ncbi:CSEP0037 putative effector protein [Blumeria hordei DH14]|uniref:CSEP0037 putative effector protein n=1 Tax=Blumeria graminis f. sp. hordei (strain DH14) TaxID=546991 RepID=N1JKH3_BLUG1|nr:CSEP0037 putative effector protein [Blumeria hordei DH14]